MSFEWAFELDDKASDPAATIAKELKRAKESLVDLSAAGAKADKSFGALGDAQLDVALASKKLGKAQLELEKSLKESGDSTGELSLEQLELAKSVQVAKKELASAEGAVESHRDAQEDLAKSMAKMKQQATVSGHALGLVKTGAKAGAVALIALSAAAAGLGFAFAKSTAEAADFARTTKNSFGALLGGADEGAAALANINDIAKATAMPLEEVRKTYGTLVSAGVGSELATDLSKLRGDWAAISEEAESAFGKFTDAMVEGKVSASQFEDIAKNIGGKQLFGEALGLSFEALQDTTEGVALLDQELAKLDPKAFLQIAVDTSKARGELGATSKAAAPLGQRLDSIAETTMQDFVSEMGITSDTVEYFAGRLETLSQSDDFKSFARTMGDAVHWAGNAFVDAAEWITENWSTIGPLLKWTAIGVGVLAAAIVAGVGIAIAPFALLSAAFYAVVAGVTWLVDAVANGITKIPEYISSAIASAKEWLSSFATDALELGSNIVDGIIEGIRSRISGAVNAAVELGSSVKNAFASVLDIASPSKVFEAFGGFITKGLVGGILGSSADAGKAAVGLGEEVEQGVIDTLGIHSPSRVLEKLGAFTTLGFQHGVNDNAVPITEDTLGVPADLAGPSMGDIGLPDSPSIDVGANVLPFPKFEAPSVAPMDIGANVLPFPKLAAPQAPSIPAPEVGTPTIPPPESISAVSVVGSSVQGPQVNASAPASTGGGGFQVTFAAGSIIVQGGGGESLGEEVQKAIVSALEKVAKQQGVAA